MTLNPGDRVYRVVTVFKDIDDEGRLDIEERQVAFASERSIVVNLEFSDGEWSFYSYDLGVLVFASRAEALDGFRAEQDRVIRSAESAIAAARAAKAWAGGVAC